MSQINSVELNNSPFRAKVLRSELEVIQDIKIELSTHGKLISNKAIMIKLLELLEIETDVVQLDVYRNALESVVYKTPDDLI
ncbi:histidine kinase [Rouxiella silvae]|uniref:Histidine kinase n=1 Tax=Rouxiella silvae TaxID=1646373 RepID=A0AA41BWV5_9GAMM|nr:biofilm development regulator YmgB/AriR family protein [Rouxiella silvae]KQN51602.1 histidine kinase [Serratia sp. Leaf50]MBF6637486.1 histidine kinase [Rouxiella silvae]ORJ19685.1 histidine kinase [Rouxiella silvae]